MSAIFSSNTGGSYMSSLSSGAGSVLSEIDQTGRNSIANKETIATDSNRMYETSANLNQNTDNVISAVTYVLDEVEKMVCKDGSYNVTSLLEPVGRITKRIRDMLPEYGAVVGNTGTNLKALVSDIAENDR